MLFSMTGFGRGEAAGDFGRLTVEIKSVNHRFSEVVLRLPRPLSPLEDRLRRLVAEGVSRGRLEVLVTWEEPASERKRVKVDKALATEYYNSLKELQAAIGSTVPIPLDALLRLPDVIKVEEVEEDLESLWPGLETAARGALTGLRSMRQREGQALAADLATRTETVAGLALRVAERAPLVVDEYRERLRKRLDELLAPGAIDETRLAQEVAILADRADISEELKRLESHLGQLRQLLQADDSVGRKFDFLLQEIGREVNTIGSKSQDLTITGIVVDLKAELEKIREQVQNVE
ncbi:MAG: YicC/YloC family endoribonuclease [Symbiobacteriia bacterium]